MVATHSDKLPILHIIGGGLAGSEAAWQALNAGFHVVLSEMRPAKMTAAHKTGDLAELVCSNSLKSMDKNSAPGLLKSEMRAFNSLILAAAEHAKVPAGQALAVDRERFSEFISDALENHPRFTRKHDEVNAIPSEAELAAKNEYWIIASGPLTSPGLAAALEGLGDGKRRLYFYDAIAPVIAADSLQLEHCFRASRYNKQENRKQDSPSEQTPAPTTEIQGATAAADTALDVEGDYINIPLSRDQYEAFVTALQTAEYMPLHSFEDAKYFESCLPIEVMVERGRETLRFGPMKPVGLVDPKTGRRPWANLQLRMENREGTMYSMVGFQTKMKWPEQKRVFGLIPALAEAEFFRFGSVHRNTYLQSPELLAADLSFHANPRVFLAGQITGVEGYTESAAIGLLAARAATAKAQELAFPMPPPTTMLGALKNYVTQGCLGDFAPMNANMGLLPPLERRRGESKVDKKARQAEAAREAFALYLGPTSEAMELPMQGHVQV